MYKAVKTVIAANNTAWTGLPAFVSAFDTYTSKVALLELHAYNQKMALVGVSAVKRAKRELIAERTLALSSSLTAFAVITNDVELINQMKISKWSIIKGEGQHALQLVDIVLNKANEHLGELGDFGIDQTVVDDFQTLRDEFEIQLTAPRSAIVERKTLTGQILVLQRDIDALLKLQLDQLMEFLREENPQFFAAYKNARVIIDQPATHQSGENEGSSFPPSEGDQGGGPLDPGEQSNSGGYGE